MESKWEGCVGAPVRLGLGLTLLGLAGCSPGEGPAAPPAPARAEAPAAAELGPPTPRARIELPVPGEPVGVLLVDLTGDGRDELVALTQSPGRLVLWEELPSASSPLARARELAVGDFALGPRALVGPEGRPRLGLASRAERSLVLVELGAAGALAEVARLELPAVPRALAAGVLGSGAGAHLEGRAVLAAALSGGEVLVWAGGATAELSLRIDAVLPCSLALSPAGDALLIGDQATRSIQRLVLREGALEPAGHIELDGIPRDITMVDLDGDGDAELLVAGGERDLWVFGLGRPGGLDALFDEPSPPLTLDAGPIPLRVVPFDVDGGHPRLALLAFYGLSFRMLEGVGQGRIERFEAHAGQSPWDLALGDPTGEGGTSVAIANRGARRISLVYPAKPAGLRLEQRVPTGPAPHSLALGDLSGDGLPAAVVLCSLDATLYLLPNVAGRLTPGKARPAGEGADDIVLSDVDGDGHLDAVWLARGDDGLFRLRVAHGDGRGNLGETVELREPTARSSGDLLATDLDGDGREELVIADPDGGRVVVRRASDGAVSVLELDGRPAALAVLESDGGRRIAVALADPGERGGIALLAPRAAQGALELAEVSFVPLGNATIGVAVCDLDGDGREDLVALVRRDAGDGPALVQALLARGPSWERLAAVQTGQRPFAIAAGDLAGTGVMDVLVSAQNNHHVNRWIFAGGPEPRLVRAPDLGAGTGCLDLVLADVNGDGRADLIVANAFSHDVTVLGEP